MDQQSATNIEYAVAMIMAHQGSDAVVRKVLEMVYRLGYLDGQIERAEAVIAKLKETA